jgi:hypothetical protein
MKNRSILAAPAIGVLLLACAWPACAETSGAGTASRERHPRSDRASGTQQAQPAAKGRAAGAEANSSANANAASEGGVGVGSQGQSMNMDNHARASASSALAPALTGSNDTCMGSTSLGAAGLAFGLSFGSTYTDDNCMMLKNARELWNMGFRGAAVARMCMDERNRQALEATGVTCPAQVGERDRRGDTNPRDRRGEVQGDAQGFAMGEPQVQAQAPAQAQPQAEAQRNAAPAARPPARRENSLRGAVSSSAQSERIVR